MKDLDAREICTIAPIMLLCLLLGVFPQPVINSVTPDLTVVTQILDARKDALKMVAPMPTKVAAAQQ